MVAILAQKSGEARKALGLHVLADESHDVGDDVVDRLFRIVYEGLFQEAHLDRSRILQSRLLGDVIGELDEMLSLDNRRGFLQRISKGCATRLSWLGSRCRWQHGPRRLRDRPC